MRKTLVAVAFFAMLYALVRGLTALSLCHRQYNLSEATGIYLLLSMFFTLLIHWDCSQAQGQHLLKSSTCSRPCLRPRAGLYP